MKLGKTLNEIMNNYRLPIVLHRHNFYHHLTNSNKEIIIKKKILFLPILTTTLSVSSLPDIPSNFPPDDFVELVILNKNLKNFIF
jgi:hypothetical protein